MTSLDSPTRRRTATTADVSAAAGVSAPTVSRVVNNTAGVAAATRSRVEAAISKLNYRRSAIAQGLAYGGL
ncbi:MAG: LacI family DNA-binding transcriptional regulator [Actinomycetota bacterium]|nr:LacI family DNA-binding transcriptional regulator [Actinomycetota bacterium]